MKTITIKLGPVFCMMWIVGVIVSEGFWHTMASFFIPFVGPITSIVWLVEVIENFVGM